MGNAVAIPFNRLNAMRGKKKLGTVLGKPVVERGRYRVEPKRIARGADPDLKFRLICFGI